jgi:LuxR family transcriptional regulator, quorum-sensing system regulator BjaR1
MRRKIPLCDPGDQIISSNFLSFFDQLAKADSLPLVASAVLKWLPAFHLKFFTYASVRHFGDFVVHRRIASNAPDTTQKRFENPVLFSNDPVIVRSRTDQFPFFWDLGIYKPDEFKAHADLLAIRHELDVTGGLCVPILEPLGWRSVFYFTGEKPDVYQQLLPSVTMFSYAAHNAFMRLRNGGDKEDIAGLLTPREREMLLWLASGRSSREIAEVLKISGLTVNKHIDNLVHKLGAKNRTDAVIKGVMFDEIGRKKGDYIHQNKNATLNSDS